MKKLIILFMLVAVLLSVIPSQVCAVEDDYAYSDTNASYVGSSPVTATTTMKYRTYIYNQLSGQYFYIYTVSENAAIDLVLDLE